MNYLLNTSNYLMFHVCLAFLPCCDTQTADFGHPAPTLPPAVHAFSYNRKQMTDYYKLSIPVFLVRVRPN